ncbi:hypothetical protein BBK82_42080 [Lentzea guizhouensis]|uniref:DUF4241 domain-containing protein n=1 Tax=Lentzea guizhouensis TaxID=1586287 RepID=A0A1B2HV02_9PSEU|nr:hypothetical protein BBK82_42080 [Lentzea guizhouensis]
MSRRTAVMAGALGVALLTGGLLTQRRSRDPGNRDPFSDEHLPAAPDPTDEPVEVVHCAGWDAASRSPVSPMSEAVARKQDAAGGQYAVVVLAGGVARAVVEVCWAAHHAEVWFVDDRGRRYRGTAYRRWPDERLRVFEVRGWRSGPDARELAGEPTSRVRVRRHADGTIRTVSTDTELSGGGKLQTSRDWADWPDPPSENVPVPAVDGWPVLAGLTGPVTVRPGPDEVPAAFPWKPPHPLRPRHITELTTDGARFRTDDGRVLTVKQTSAGTIRLPSGKLLVADPGWLHVAAAPLAVPVAPGQYAVDVFQVAENGKPETTWTVACRMTVTDAPVASWELAPLEGDVALELGEGEFSGNPVDTATLALLDHTGSAAFPSGDVDTAMPGDAPFRRLSAGQTDVVVVPGWSDGSFPVWVGRAADGSPSRFVVDFLVPDLCTAEPA